MPDTSGSLCYAVRPTVLLALLGRFFLILAGLGLPVVLVAALHGEWRACLANLAVAALLALSGLLLARGREPGSVQRNEAVILVCLIYLLSSAVMALPMLLEGMPLQDALFESISGLTTTGLSTLATVEDTSATFLFARAWRQWYGGLGIVVFSLALLLQPGATAKGLSALESDDEDLVGGVKAHMRDLLRIYLGITAAAVLLIWLVSPDFFTALLHALAAISTGGFSSFDASLSGVDNVWFAPVVILACVAGSFPLVFFWRSYTRVHRHAFLWLQVLGVLALGLALSLALAVCLQSALVTSTWGQALYHGLVTGFSAQSTAGFSTIPIADFPDVGKLLLIVAMFIGGGVGSTAGGVKVLRLFVALKVLLGIMRRSCLPPHAVYKPTLFGVKLKPHGFEEALSLIFAYCLALVLSWLAFVAHGLPPLDSLFEVASALGTVGLSSGLCGPELPTALKGVLAADMLLGRLEVMAWLVFFSPWNWTSRRQ